MDTFIGATFRKPFPEQVAAFRARLGNLVPTAKWDDIERAAHDRAFMVAGAAKADLLADLAAAVDKSIAKGTSLEEFRKDFRKIVATRGWHGWTGEGTQKGEAWRTRVIYRTNAATSYAAGRTAQLVDENFKYWVYRHGASLEPRDQHLAWDGLILPPSHPFWLKHAPPNGWGCSCYIVGARSIAGAKRVGGKPGLTLPSDWDAIDAQTGVPRGIDRGWDYSPGASVVSTIQSLRAKLDTLPDQPSIALIQDWLLHDVFANWLKSPVGSWPIARLTKADAAAIGSQKLVADLSADTVAKQMRRHPEITATDYVQAQRVVTSPTHTVQDTPNSIIFVRAVEGEDGFVLVVKATRSGEGLFLTSLRRLSSDEAQRDRTIGQLLRKS